MREEDARAKVAETKRRQEAAEAARLAREMTEENMIKLAIAESLKDLPKLSDSIKQ
jgi:thiazole synthase ThiGH ThiG subunit